MSTGTALFVLVLLLALNAYFVAAEFAMVTARRDQVEPRALQGSTAAKLTLKGIENVSISLAATQLGITACSLLIGAVGEPALAHLMEGPLVSVGLPAGLSHLIALIIALLIVTFLHMVLGEMVPKNIAIARPAPSALALGPVLYVVVAVARPIIWLMNTTANHLVRLFFKVEPRDEVASSVDADQMRNLVATSGEEGLLDEDEVALLSGAIGFEQGTAADVAVPAAQLATLPRDATPAQVEEACVRTGFSRFPLTDEAGTFVGYVHTKDVLELDGAAAHRPIPDELVRPLGRVGAEDRLRTVLGRMQRASAHMAVMSGAGAGVGSGEGAAVVMLEDVLEELVGEVTDATRR